MLKQARADATLPVQDLERAKAWYSEKLGLTPSREDPVGGAYYELGQGTRILLFPSSGKPSGTHTQLAFEVEDLAGEVRDLKARGLKFEEYNSPPLVTVDGIAEMDGLKAAWFKDSEGNLLAIGTPVPVTAARRS